MITSAVALLLGGQPVEVIPHIRRSAVPTDYELVANISCPSGLALSIRGYSIAVPPGARARVLVNGRPLRGAHASRLAEDLSQPDAVYRFNPSCDRDRRRAWLSIEIARPGEVNEVRYFAATAFIEGGRITAYTPPRPVPAQSFWVWGSRDEPARGNR
jgi:hypothetical protein